MIENKGDPIMNDEENTTKYINWLEKRIEQTFLDFKAMREIAIDLINPDKGDQTISANKHIDELLIKRTTSLQGKRKERL